MKREDREGEVIESLDLNSSFFREIQNYCFLAATIIFIRILWP
jgi:hypothetical protein